MEKTIEELILQELREIKGAVNSLGVRMDAIESRMDSLERRMDSLESKMDSLEQRMDSLETRMDLLEQRMDSLEQRVGSLETRVNALEEMVADIAENVTEIRTACNSLLDWADEVYAIESVNNPNYARVGGVGMRNVKKNIVGEEEARYYVEARGKRTYY